MKGWFWPGMMAMLLWGLWGFFPKLTVRHINPGSALVFETLGGMIVALVVLVVLGFRIQTNPAGVGYALFTGVCGFLGILFYLKAVTVGRVSLVATMTALYPVVSVLLAHFVLGEPLTLKEGAGILLACLAILLMVL